MKTYIKRYFMSWSEAGETATALVEPDGDWFYEAINCLRDGDMGEKDDAGVYERKWYGDGIYGCGNADKGTKRLATISESKLWLKYCSAESEYSEKEKLVAIVFSSEGSYVIYESLSESLPDREDDLSCSLEKVHKVLQRLETLAQFYPARDDEGKNKFLTRDEVCKICHISKPTFHKWVKDGAIEAIKVGGRTLVKAESLEAALQARKVYRYKHRN